MKIKIEKLIYEGFGLGHDEAGKAIFVKKSVPGDLLEVEIIKDKKNYSEAVIKNVIQPSPMRVTPRCPHFGSCGGCNHQNIDYNDQLRLKGEIFAETLSRAKVETAPLPIIPGSASDFYYRNTIVFSFFLDGANNISLAMHDSPHFTELIPIDQCFLQSEFANQIMAEIKDFINNHFDDKSIFKFLQVREGKATREFMIRLITNTTTLPHKEEFIALLKKHPEIRSFYHSYHDQNRKKQFHNHLFGDLVIHEKVGRIKYQMSPLSFFQTNSMGVKTLYDTVKDFADIKMGESILDLFCGAGTIGIYLSTLAKKVLGVELNQNAINDAKANVKINNVKNAEFICDDAWYYLNKLDSPFDIIVFDPPRAGLMKEMIKNAARVKPKKIVYASCDPATFARDIKEFENYGFSLIKVQPIDMFPQTCHIECVGLLTSQK